MKMNLCGLPLSPRKTAGFSMVEVLVSLLILSIGLLGMVALQARAIQENQGAYLRSQASIETYDILERMRANKAAAEAGAYNIAMGVTKISSSNAMAKIDLNDWVTGLSTSLPSGKGSISCSAASCTVAVQWFDNAVNDDTNNDKVVDDKDKYQTITLVTTL
jgi:type IV pilus assembly protein PilV